MVPPQVHRLSLPLLESMMNNSSSKNKLAFIVALLGTALIFISCSSDSNKESDDSGDDRIVPVRVYHVMPQTLELTVQATGVIRSHDQCPITPEVAGKVVEKIRDVGDPVSIGTVILAIDPEPYALAEAQADAGYRSAQVAYEQTQRDYQRAEELKTSEDISQNELEAMRLQERTAFANLSSAEAAYKLAQRNLRLTEVVSPIYGSVAQLNVQIGQQVSPGIPLGTIISSDNIEVEVGLSERDIIKMVKGIRVEITTDVFPERSFAGTVRRIGQAGLNMGRTFPVVITIDNNEGLLKPGMIVKAQIIWAERSQVLAVPREALVSGSEKPLLYIVEDKIAIGCEVKLGSSDGNKIIIESGIAEGDLLVVEGQNVLRDSIKVEIF
ncbi:hypothetical protein CEE37_03595 [candidate division LCP-89 bacterium B3_LCP]|uniref:Uncharacterized protein n=1 Tax=candidate division LCP-89 bacterium B3_LCP TaxID=2012998 RepID=A0A532V386_UNCL8|nr:MAG: hypothetical protein CEE37_03595 [candidate division LCP-89 bacterium B3_LCP]